jgi:uncharacterized SAM-binding protein YcdF (DUF218 family)
LDLYWVKQLVKTLILPPAGPLLLIIAGLAIGTRQRRRGRMLAATGALVLVLLSMPAVGIFLGRLLDGSPALDPAKTADAQAIVILSGGTRPYAAEYGGPTLGGITLDRVRYGARLARMTGLPVLVSGGTTKGAPPEALLMRNVLVQEYGVPVRWVETRSRDTHENAVKSASILKASGIARVILVGHSFDFPRTRKEFEAAGIAVTPAPIGIPPKAPTEFGDFLPTVGGLQRTYYVLYEILGNAFFELQHFREPNAAASIDQAAR